MLGKLIKNDFIECSKMMGLCIIVMIIIVVVSLIDTALEQTVGVSLELWYILTGIAILAVMFIAKYYFFYRYYKNLFTDEGYLMLTLPVETRDIVLSKAISAFLWQAITAVVAILLFFIFSFFEDILDGSVIFDYFIPKFPNIELSSVLSFIIFLFGSFVSLLVQFLAVSIGQLAHKNRFRKSIFMLIAIDIIKTISFGGLSSFGSIFSLYSSLYISDNYELSTYILQIVETIIIGVIAYLLDVYILKNKVNLE